MSQIKPSEIFSTILYSNGVYQGFSQNKLRKGLGVYIWDSGEIYFGTFFFEILWKKTKKNIKGEWQNDNIEGEGYFFQPTGTLIHSQFSNNKVHGPGILKLTDSVWISR